LTDGIDPDSFTVTTAISDSQSAPAKEVTITFSDGYNTISMSNMRLSQEGTKISNSATGINVDLRYLDSRWKWKYSPLVVMEYNRRDEKGNIISKDKNFGKIIEYLCQYIGIYSDDETRESALALVSSSDNDDRNYPYINWQNVRADIALAEICERYGVRICLGSDNITRFYYIGNGASYDSSYAQQFSISYPAPEIPSWVKVRGGRCWFQQDVDLEAVAYDPKTSEFLPLSSISYLPANGYWHPDIAKEFEANGSVAEAWSVSNTLFKCYRIKNDTITLTGSREFNGGTDEVLTRNEASMRWLDHIVSLGTSTPIDPEVRRESPYVTGKYCDIDRYGSPFHANAGTNARVPSFSRLDRRLGIVWFNDPVFDIGNDLMIGASALKLTCAFAGPYYEYDDFGGSVPNAIDKDNSIWIYRDDLRYEYINGASTNSSETWRKVDGYILEEIKKYSFVSNPRTTVYGGIFDYSPDGIISEVEWNISTSDTPTTVVGYDVQLNVMRPMREVRNAMLNIGKNMIERRQKMTNGHSKIREENYARN
jgi:hypothetical protein